MSGFFEKLCLAAGNGQVMRDEMMNRHTTFRVGGPASYFVSPDGDEALKKSASPLPGGTDALLYTRQRKQSSGQRQRVWRRYDLMGGFAQIREDVSGELAAGAGAFYPESPERRRSIP